MAQPIEQYPIDIQGHGFSEKDNRLAMADRSIPKDLNRRQFAHSAFRYNAETRTLVFPNGEKKFVKGRNTHEDLIRFLERPSETISLEDIDPIYPKNAKKRVQRLRKEIGDSGKDPRIVISRRGFGYFLTDKDNTLNSEREIQPDEEVVLFDKSQQEVPSYDIQSLTPQENQLFNALTSNRGGLVEEDKLLSALSERGRKSSNGNLRFYISILRKKGLHIGTVIGVGYILE